MMEEMVDYWFKKYGGKSVESYPSGSLLNELPPSDYQMGN
jgi:hypothetical protein